MTLYYHSIYKLRVTKMIEQQGYICEKKEAALSSVCGMLGHTQNQSSWAEDWENSGPRATPRFRQFGRQRKVA